MQCPYCLRFVSEEDDNCRHCGGKLDPWAALKRLQEEAGKAQQASAELTQRLEMMRKRLLAMEGLLWEEVPEAEAPPAEPAPAPAPQPPSVPRPPLAAAPFPVPSPVPSPATTAPASSTGRQERLAPSPSLSEARLGQKWLLIIGVVTLLLGIGYFLKYSFDRNWLGPAGRVAISFLAGGACVAAGELFRRKGFRLFGLYLIGGGVAVFYFSSYAAYQIYHLIPASASFAVMGLVTVFAWALAVAYDTQWLAVLGIIGGFLTPLVLGTGEDDLVGQMSYLAVLNAGILAIAFYKRWPLLNILGFGGTWGLFSLWYGNHYQDARFWPTTFFINLFFLLYTLVPFAYHLKRDESGKVQGLAIVALNGFIAFGYSFVTIRAHASLPWVTLVSLAYAALFLGMASFLHRRRPAASDPFVLLLAKGILFLVIAVPLFFSRQWISFFWAAQAAALCWAALRMGNARLYRGSHLLLALAVGKLFLFDYVANFHLSLGTLSFEGGYAALLPERALALVMVLGALFLCSRMSLAAGPTLGDEKEASSAWTALLGAFLALLLLGLTVETAAFFHQYSPLSVPEAVSILWAGFAFLLLFWAAGKAAASPGFRFAAFALLTVALVKTVVFDYANHHRFAFDPFRLQEGFSHALFERWLALAAVLGATWLAARLARAGKMTEAPSLFTAFGVALFAVLNVETATFFHQYAPEAAFAAISVLWGVFAAALMALGFLRRLHLLRTVSLVLFAFTGAKVFLFDMSKVATPFRILSFLVLGVLLIAASWLYHRYRDRLLPAGKEPEKEG